MSIKTREEWLKTFDANPELSGPFRAMIAAREEDRQWPAEKFVNIIVWRLTEFEIQGDDLELEEVYEIIEHWCQENCEGRYNKTIYGSWYEFELAHDAELFNARWNY